jgi:hypothetical protein
MHWQSQWHTKFNPQGCTPMPSLKTLYRAVVMVATGIIVFKGWQLYGPTSEQMKTGAARALELAQDALSQVRQASAQNEPTNVDPRSASPTFAATANATIPPAQLAVAPPPSGMINSATNSFAVPPITTPPAATTEAPHLLSQDQDPPTMPAAETEKLPALMSRLEALGVADPKLAAWGSTGKLYRFCCRAKLGDTAAYTKHFESVADEPAAAVEQVVAKVEAWRLAQNGRNELR